MKSAIAMTAYNGETPEHVLQDVLLRAFIDIFEEHVNMELAIKDVIATCIDIKNQWPQFAFKRDVFLRICHLVELTIIARTEMIGYPVNNARKQYQQYIYKLERTLYLFPKSKEATLRPT